jgi:hypothetical protein
MRISQRDPRDASRKAPEHFLERFTPALHGAKLSEVRPFLRKSRVEIDCVVKTRSETLQTVGLNQFYYALEARSNIQRETIERLLDVLIQELNDPRHYPKYTFFAMFARIVLARVFRLRVESLDPPDPEMACELFWPVCCRLSGVQRGKRYPLAEFVLFLRDVPFPHRSMASFDL